MQILIPRGILLQRLALEHLLIADGSGRIILGHLNLAIPAKLGRHHHRHRYFPTPLQWV